MLQWLNVPNNVRDVVLHFIELRLVGGLLIAQAPRTIDNDQSVFVEFCSAQARLVHKRPFYALHFVTRVIDCPVENVHVGCKI